jgi:hypothetical protein
MEKPKKERGEFFVEPIDSLTNTYIVNELNRLSGMQPELEHAEYAGRDDIPVFKVSYSFIKELYENKGEKNLKFRIFIRVHGSFRCWELFRPDVMRKARLAGVVERGGPPVRKRERK